MELFRSPIVFYKKSNELVSLNTLFMKILKTLHKTVPSCQTLLFLKTVLKDIFSSLSPPPPLWLLGRSGGREPRPPPRILEITLLMLHTVCFLLFSGSESSSLLTWRMAEFTMLSSSPGLSATEISWKSILYREES